jgi:hypothetical protein
MMGWDLQAFLLIWDGQVFRPELAGEETANVGLPSRTPIKFLESLKVCRS